MYVKQSTTSIRSYHTRELVMRNENSEYDDQRSTGTTLMLTFDNRTSKLRNKMRPICVVSEYQQPRKIVRSGT